MSVERREATLETPRTGWRRALLDWRIGAFAAATACAVAFAAEGVPGLSGMALGLFATTFSILALWGIVRLLGEFCRDRPPAPWMQVLLFAAFLAKLPLLWVAWLLAANAGDPAPTCFLLGLGLVYSALVGWVLAQS